MDVSPDVSLEFRYIGQCEISDEIKAGLEESLPNLYCKDISFGCEHTGFSTLVSLFKVRNISFFNKLGHHTSMMSI